MLSVLYAHLCVTYKVATSTRKSDGRYDRMPPTLLRWFLSALICIVALGGGSVRAQDETSTEPTDTRQETRLGEFIVGGGLTVTELYDDNIFATEEAEEGDYVTIVTPELYLESDWQQHRLRLVGGAEIGRYASNGAEDYEDFWLGADGRYDISDDSNVFGGARLSQEHEDRESPDAVAGTEPTTFTRLQNHLGLEHKIEAASLRLGLTAERLDFDDVSRTGGIINNDDRDRTMYEGGGRVGYRVRPGLEPFVQGVYDLRRYDDGADDNGFDRDSEGFGLAAGFQARLAAGLGVEALTGYLHQAYEDFQLDDVDSVDFGLRLLWNSDRGTTINGFVDRTVEETTLARASAALDTVFGVSAEHAVFSDLLLTGRAVYIDSDFEGIARQDDIYSLGAGLKYFFLPNFFVGGEYRLLVQDSSEIGQDYVDNRVLLRLGAQIAPEFAPEAATPAGPSGVYAGVQAGYGITGSSLKGPRGSGGTLSAEFGAGGATGGAFAGYARALGPWRLGLELEGEASSAEWDHARSPGGRVFSVRRTDSFGAAVRIGYALESGAILYGRAGPVLSNFRTEYDHGHRNIEQDDRQAGVRFGAGIEVPTGEALFLRLDYTYTDYSDYGVSTNDTDVFNNRESLARFGLGYRFYHDPGAGPARSSPSFTGAYGGLRGGYGEVASQNTGPRQAGSTLDAERANGGFVGGVFAGYGYDFGGPYLGLEAEGELGDGGWEQAREPTGRVYSVEKDYGLGGSARVGYVLGNAALVYARVGLVRAHFVTAYDVGANSIGQDDDLTGVRFGGGIEAPVSQKLFLRFDYSYTDYGDFDVDYNSGVDTFDNIEGLVQLGIGYRF